MPSQWLSVFSETICGSPKPSRPAAALIGVQISPFRVACHEIDILPESRTPPRRSYLPHSPGPGHPSPERSFPAADSSSRLFDCVVLLVHIFLPFQSHLLSFLLVSRIPTSSNFNRSDLIFSGCFSISGPGICLRIHIPEETPC